MAEGETAWKQRYREAQERIEAERRAAMRIESGLRSAVRRLAVLGLGSDPELDRRLNLLRRSVRRDESSDELLRNVDSVSECVRRLADLGPEGSLESGDSGLTLRHFLLYVLSLLRAEHPEDGRIAGLITRVRGARVAELGPLTQSVENLVAQYFQSSGTAPRSGWLARWFRQGTAQSDEGIKALMTLTERLRREWPQPALESLAERLNQEGEQALVPVSLELAELLQGVFREREPVSAPEASATPGEAEGEWQRLQELVTALRLPEEYSDATRALADGAREAFRDPARLSGWLEELAGLVRQHRVRLEQEQRELRHFLERTLGHLAELDGHLDASTEEIQRSNQHAHELDRSLSGELDALDRSRREGQELGSLQEAIESHIQSLRKGLKMRRRLDAEREQRLEQRLREMRERVSELEGETDELRNNLRREHRHAVRDPLTRLPNRRAYLERVAYERARQQRRGYAMTLALCMLQDISVVNQRLGREAGDVALAEFAERLSDQMHPGEFVARLDGVEFVLLLPGMDRDQARERVEQIDREVIGRGFEYEDIEFSFSALFGLAGFGDELSPEEVLRRARNEVDRQRREETSVADSSNPG